MNNSTVTLTINELKNRLSVYNPDMLVVYDFGGSPHIRHAYHNDVAFSVSETTPSYRDNKVEGLLLALRCALGAVIGQDTANVLTATENTRVWAAEGDYVTEPGGIYSVWVHNEAFPVRAIVGVEQNELGQVVLITSAV